MTPLRLMLLILIFCGLAVPACVLVGERPDEVATTRAWLVDARRQATRMPTDLHTPGAAPAEAQTPPPAALQDPFGLHRQEATLAVPSEPPRSRSGDEAHSTADASHEAAPLPAMRMLGSLRQDDVQLALVEIAGTTYRVTRGDTLPGGAGKVLAIRDDAMDISDDSTTRTLTITPMPAQTSPSRPPGQGKRRLIRPGARA